MLSQWHKTSRMIDGRISSEIFTYSSLKEVVEVTSVLEKIMLYIS
jgi:hypothetical protein